MTSPYPICCSPHGNIVTHMWVCSTMPLLIPNYEIFAMQRGSWKLYQAHVTYELEFGGRCFLFHYVSMFYILRYNKSFVLHKLTLVVLSYCTNCKNIVARFHLPNTRTSIMAMSDLLISLTQGYNKYLTKGRLSNYNWIKLAII